MHGAETVKINQEKQNCTHLSGRDQVGKLTISKVGEGSLNEGKPIANIKESKDRHSETQRQFIRKLRFNSDFECISLRELRILETLRD